MNSRAPGGSPLKATSLGSSAPIIGLSELFPAFAGAFLGATPFRPGRYDVVGTLVAVYLVGTGIIGLQQLGGSGYVEQFFIGGAIAHRNHSLERCQPKSAAIGHLVLEVASNTQSNSDGPTILAE
jgi:hypothetical protein